MLKLRNVNSYYGQVQVLWDISLEVDEGEIVALVGSNGAGKTTLMDSISRIISSTSGVIEFDGERIDKLPPHKIVRKGISYVPERRRLFPTMTVLENLYLGSYVPEAKKKRRESLEYVFGLFPILRERRNQLAGTLSGGEQQMLAIGRGLMARPKLLLLDEISLGLAPKIVKLLFQTIEKINKEEGVSILIAEQNIYHALQMAERGYVLENGKITLVGKGKELLNDEHIKEAYLGYKKQ